MSNYIKEDGTLDIDAVKSAPDNSITDPEVIRLIALKRGPDSEFIYQKIKSGYEYVGLYPDVLNLDTHKKTERTLSLKRLMDKLSQLYPNDEFFELLKKDNSLMNVADLIMYRKDCNEEYKQKIKIAINSFYSENLESPLKFDTGIESFIQTFHNKRLKNEN